MPFIFKTVLFGFLALLIAAVAVAPAPAAVYKYKEDGVWHFTDDPGQVPASQRDASSDAPPAAHGGTRNLSEQLRAALRPANDIETATMATVAIETSFGYGSGFFVTGDGYILTNKHVIRLSPETGTKDDPAAASTVKTLEHYQAQLDRETKRLEQARSDLENFRQYIDSQPESSTRDYNENRYREGLQRFRSWEQSVDEQRQKLDSERSRFETSLVQQRLDASLAGLNRNFTIYLADNTPLYAYLVEVSDQHDLALLKVDGYTTPFIQPISPYASAQGDPVYAIGNPVKLRNSVTSGVVSGFEGPFVKTNAQIYPGNSGGPLVTAQGRVIGVNTFKRLTHKFEGLGFAISINVAMEAFDGI
ncbi:trypsin-like peptidase domain-containing protein [uncultured Desulfosarcina sp.]|uniref:S1C family serine protease n=1 Tax=uncultured Desulfosarcina sp. TaxID=218289 RepID=UPI0029C6126F|nr:trypsin-like peptidase domain-containing protein [uncultured Desulfosarcina sp.]